MTCYCAYFKSILDFVLASFAVMFLWPVGLLLALLCYIFFQGKILFKQERSGLNAKPFVIYKFCTMLNTCDSKGNLLPDAVRLTKFGKFLRRTSLDELPEIFNVLKGEMSLIGPRPLPMKYLPRYTIEQFKRYSVKPGITGWAQINGRNSISWEEKFKYDVWYVDNLSFLLDVKILFLTVNKVITGCGVSALSHATMTEFLGIDSNERNVQRELNE
ncbi:MAG: sugar transferase [Gammaproteobacteria bacterium]|jgi:sugar transferase EpsL